MPSLRSLTKAELVALISKKKKAELLAILEAPSKKSRIGGGFSTKVTPTKHPPGTRGATVHQKAKALNDDIVSNRPEPRPQSPKIEAWNRSPPRTG